MATDIKSLDGLALLGVKAHVQPGEVFAGGTVNGNRMVLTFTRGAFTRQACKGIRRMRLVTCERSFHDGDFKWVPTVEALVNL